MSKEGGVRSFRYFLFSSAFLFSTCKYTTFSEPSNSPPFSSPHPLHRYLTAHCSLLTAHCLCVSPSHRRTVAFIAIACRENQYCKTKRKIIKQYKILIINILYNIIIYNNIINFYSIVSFSVFSSSHVCIGLM